MRFLSRPENGSLVVDLTVSGWSPKPGNIKKMTKILKNLKLGVNDTVVIDVMSNSAFLGTGEDGLPVTPAKSCEDGQCYLTGDLQLAPIPAFKTNLRQIETLLEQGGGGGGARAVILVPLPRYVPASCCGDGGHVTITAPNKISSMKYSEWKKD